MKYVEFIIQIILVFVFLNLLTMIMMLIKENSFTIYIAAMSAMSVLICGWYNRKINISKYEASFETIREINRKANEKKS